MNNEKKKRETKNGEPNMKTKHKRHKMKIKQCKIKDLYPKD